MQANSIQLFPSYFYVPAILQCISLKTHYIKDCQVELVETGS